MPLKEEEINESLKNGYWRVNVCKETGSTQSDLSAQIRAGLSRHGEVRAAEFQSAGRGRLDRKFATPPNSALLFSLFILPKRAEGSWGWLPLLAGEAVVTALDSILPEAARPGLSLKWPNDVLLNGKKLAGILSERIDSKSGPGVIIGIGINVHATREELGFANATSMQIEGYLEVDREGLLVSILDEIAIILERWEMADPDIVERYLARSSTVGSQVRIETPAGEIIQALAVGIKASGALVLDNGDQITVGDVVHLHLE